MRGRGSSWPVADGHQAIRAAPPSSVSHRMTDVYERRAMSDDQRQSTGTRCAGSYREHLGRAERQIKVSPRTRSERDPDSNRRAGTPGPERERHRRVLPQDDRLPRRCYGSGTNTSAERSSGEEHCRVAAVGGDADNRGPEEPGDRSHQCSDSTTRR